MIGGGITRINYQWLQHLRCNVFGLIRTLRLIIKWLLIHVNLGAENLYTNTRNTKPL